MRVRAKDWPATCLGVCEQGWCRFRAHAGCVNMARLSDWQGGLMDDLGGLRALVTGGGSGIGAVIAATLARAWIPCDGGRCRPCDGARCGCRRRRFGSGGRAVRRGGRPHGRTRCARQQRRHRRADGAGRRDGPCGLRPLRAGQPRIDVPLHPQGRSAAPRTTWFDRQHLVDSRPVRVSAALAVRRPPSGASSG